MPINRSLEDLYWKKYYSGTPIAQVGVGMPKNPLQALWCTSGADERRDTMYGEVWDIATANRMEEELWERVERAEDDNARKWAAVRYKAIVNRIAFLTRVRLTDNAHPYRDAGIFDPGDDHDPKYELEARVFGLPIYAHRGIACENDMADYIDAAGYDEYEVWGECPDYCECKGW